MFKKLKIESLSLESLTINSINDFEREICIDFLQILESDSAKNQIKLLHKKNNKKENLHHKTNLASFASDWKRNQTLAHNQVVSELNLFNGGLSLFKINEKIKTTINNNILSPQYDKIKILYKTSDYLVNKKGNDLLNQEVDKLAENIIHVNFDTILENEEENILSISHVNSSTTELISAESFNVLFEHQNDSLESVPLNLSIIQDHIIQLNYLGPLQENTQKLEKVYNQISEEIYNTANLIKHLTQDIGKTEPNDDETTNNIQNRITSMLNGLDEISLAFNHETATNLHNTISDLKIRNIIESADSLPTIGFKPVVKTKFQNWYEHKTQVIDKVYHSIISFIIQRQQDIDSLKFNKKHNQYLSNIEQVSKFVNSLQINPAVHKTLPFYYKKLFTGSHIANSNSNNRANEMSAAHQAINRINSGISGAILILGESLSGKTYFSERLSKSIKKLESYIINPPNRQKYDINDLHLAFQKTFNKSGTTDAILGQMNPKTIFVFNNIEKWWIKGKNGSVVINYLAKMIEKHGSKHYFILNCNIHSYYIIRKTSKLDKQILSSIIMSPASKFELKEIILNRHKIAGAEIWYENDLINDSKKADRLFADIHQKSGGNIGVALNMWIYSIAMDLENNLFISKPKNTYFPNIQDAKWKLVLYQFLMHHKLSLEQIQKIFLSDNIEWIISTLSEMEKSGLVHHLPNNIYMLEKNTKYYIENWLKMLKIIS